MQFLVNHLEESGILEPSSDVCSTTADGDTTAAAGATETVAGALTSVRAHVPTHGESRRQPAISGDNVETRHGRGPKFVQDLRDRSAVLGRRRSAAELKLREVTAMGSDHVLLAWCNYSLSRLMVEDRKITRRVRP